MTNVDAGDLTEKQLIPMLTSYLDYRKQRDNVQSTMDTISGVLKGWLRAHPGEILRDGERGIRARIQESSGSFEMDVAGLPENLLAWAAEHRLLKLDAATWKALSDKAVEMIDLKPYVYTGKGTERLQVEKEKP